MGEGRRPHPLRSGSRTGRASMPAAATLLPRALPVYGCLVSYQLPSGPGLLRHPPWVALLIPKQLCGAGCFFAPYCTNEKTDWGTWDTACCLPPATHAFGVVAQHSTLSCSLELACCWVLAALPETAGCSEYLVPSLRQEPSEHPGFPPYLLGFVSSWGEGVALLGLRCQCLAIIHSVGV